MANLISKIGNMDIVWRQCGQQYFYRDFIVK